MPKSTIETGEVVKNIQKECNGVTLTLDSGTADYLLEADYDSYAEGRHPGRGAKITLFARNGDLVFNTQTRQVHNGFKDMCVFIEKRKKG